MPAPARKAEPFCALTPLIAAEPGIGMPSAVVRARPAQSAAALAAAEAAIKVAVAPVPAGGVGMKPPVETVEATIWLVVTAIGAELVVAAATVPPAEVVVPNAMEL